MHNHDNYKKTGEDRPEPDPGDNRAPRDKLFADLDDNEEFEEPDRDSDYAAVFTEEEELEWDPEDDIVEEEEVTAATERGHIPWEDADDDSVSSWDSDDWEDDTAPPEPQIADAAAAWSTLSSLPAAGQEDDPDSAFDGDDEEAWDDDGLEEEERENRLPLGMIVVGIVALVLLGTGGYGVMQDRAALQEEIRQLQGELATAASPEEVARVRAASETLQARHGELEQQVADLTRENRSLQAIIGGLETQLQAQQEALAQKPAAPPPTAPAPRKVATEPAAAKTASKPAPAPAAGSWFVNFGSYTQRTTAENWSKRLEPGAGDVVVTTGEKDGRTYYRVRVINLPSKEVANSTARKLEQAHDLSRLWVGRAS